MVDKNKRTYIMEFFNSCDDIKDGDIIEFEMPSFCSGEYRARIYIDNDGDPYIDQDEDYFSGCRDYEIIKK
jgi:hypothetical protein